MKSNKMMYVRMGEGRGSGEEVWAMSELVHIEFAL